MLEIGQASRYAVFAKLANLFGPSFVTAKRLV